MQDGEVLLTFAWVPPTSSRISPTHASLRNSVSGLESHRFRKRPKAQRDLVASGVRERRVCVDGHMAIMVPASGQVNDAD